MTEQRTFARDPSSMKRGNVNPSMTGGPADTETPASHDFAPGKTPRLDFGPIDAFAVNKRTNASRAKREPLTVDDDFDQLEGHFVSTSGRAFVFPRIRPLIQDIDQQRTIREGSLSVIIGYSPIICRCMGRQRMRWCTGCWDGETPEVQLNKQSERRGRRRSSRRKNFMNSDKERPSFSPLDPHIMMETTRRTRRWRRRG